MRSVVLASFHGERFIREQLESILSQLAPEDEVIVSDDASTDRTLEIVRQLNDPRIKIVPNSARVGYVGNFERAIRHASGTHIFFADQDDVWLPGKVLKICSALFHHACAASDAVVVNEDLVQLHQSYFELRGAKSFSWPAIFFKPSVIGATLACRKDYLELLMPFPAGVPHDFWISLNAAWDNVLHIIPDPLILYRRHSQAHSPTAIHRPRPIAKIVAERSFIARCLLLRRLKANRN